ncbi:MAG: nucleotidyltransferase domain-containing protein [Spirochaetota bacterium]
MRSIERDTTQNISATLSSYFRERDDISLVILYGSAASGQLTGESDIDVAVAGDASLSPDTRSQLYFELSELLRRNVDICDIRGKKGLFLTQVLTKGKVLINRKPELLAQLIINMLDFQEDMLPNVRMIMLQHARDFIHGS